MKKYPKYKDSGVEWLGEIPSDWNRNRIKFCFNSINGGVWGEEPIGDANDIVCIRVADFDYKHGVIDTSNFTTRNISLSEQKNRLLKKGDLLIEKSGGGELSPVGRIVKFDLDIKAVCSNFINRLNTKKQFNADFLNYLNRYLYSRGITESCINQTTGIQNLKVSEFVSNVIFIPSLPEQLSIVQFLDHKTDRIDRFIANRQKQIELLKEQKAAIINKAVTKGIGSLSVSTERSRSGVETPNAKMKDSGNEWIGEVPEHWEIVKLKFLTRKIGSGVTPLGGYEVYKTEGVAFFRSQNIYNDKFELSNISFIEEETHLEMKNSKVLFGDVLLNITGASIGRCFYYSGEYPEANVNQHVCIIRANKNILFRFLHLVMISEIGQNQILSMQSGSNREGLNFEQLKRFEIPLPPKVEQKEILTYIKEETSTIDTLISKYQKQIDLMQEYRTALISQAVTGKICLHQDLQD